MLNNFFDVLVFSLACAGGHLNVVEVLLQQGADPFHKLKVNQYAEIYSRYICRLKA